MTTVRNVLLGLALAALASAPVAFADDTIAQQLFEKASDLYNLHRADSLQVSRQILDTLNKAEAEVSDPELRYDILVLASRTLYWEGQHTAGDENKKTIFLAGKDKADQAILVLGQYSEAYYFAGINLARWAEANGIVASISQKGKLVEYMKSAADLTRTTRDGGEGALVDGSGPDRVLGRMYEKLPGVLGGDRDRAIQLLRRAVKNSPKNSLNVLYLADSLLKGNKEEKAEGQNVLKDLLKNTPETFGAEYDRVPETREEFELARALLAGKPLP